MIFVSACGAINAHNLTSPVIVVKFEGKNSFIPVIVYVLLFSVQVLLITTSFGPSDLFISYLYVSDVKSIDC